MFATYSVSFSFLPCILFMHQVIFLLFHFSTIISLRFVNPLQYVLVITLDIITCNVDLIESSINLNTYYFYYKLESQYTLSFSLSSFLFLLSCFYFYVYIKLMRCLSLLNALNVCLDLHSFHCSLFLLTFLCFSL